MAELPAERPSRSQVVVDDPLLVRSGKEPAEPSGPVTFAVSGADVIVDDELTEVARLVTYRHQQRVDSVRLPAGQFCLDLRVEGTHSWVLGAESVSEYSRPKGASTLELVRQIPLPAEPGVQWEFGTLERDGDSVFAVPFVGDPVLVSGPGPTSEQWSSAADVGSVTIDDPWFTATLATRTGAYPPRLLTRHGSHVYYLVVDDVSKTNGGYVYDFTSTGEVAHTYTLLPNAERTPDRSILVADDGRVYQMRISPQTARIDRISPNT